MQKVSGWGLLLCAGAAMAQAQSGISDVQAGRQFYLGHCAQCHGPEGEGGRGVNLTTGQYRVSRTDNDLLRVIQGGLPGTEMPPSRLPVSDLRRLVAYVRSLGQAGAQEKATGDVAAGAAVYGRLGCGGCHTVSGQGGSLGPPLDSIGLRRSLKFLRESLVTPDAYVAKEYVGASAVTRTGDRVTGLRLNEDDYSLQIRDAKEKVHSFLKTRLETFRRLESSLMPSYGKLPPVELENLVTYLNSLKVTGE